MSWTASLSTFVKKYGPVAKVVASGVLNVVAPGSASLIRMTEVAIDATHDAAKGMAHAEWERQVLARLDTSQAEVERLGQMIEYLAGPLAHICDKAASFADDPEDLADIVGRAIARDPSLSATLHEIQALKSQFDAFHDDIRRIAEHQEEAIPVYERMNRMCDYFDELWDAGVKPRDFAHHISTHLDVTSQIERGNVGELDDALLEMRSATPRAASVCVLEAAAASREFNYSAAQRALTRAVKLRPADGELADLARQVTVMATRATPHSRPPEAETG